jgi:hypothetical protein
MVNHCPNIVKYFLLAEKARAHTWLKIRGKE